MDFPKVWDMQKTIFVENDLGISCTSNYFYIKKKWAVSDLLKIWNFPEHDYFLLESIPKPELAIFKQ